ncbi:MAG: twin-arginine translocase TatA/TatE family subunit [Pseudomonadota bacterium]
MGLGGISIWQLLIILAIVVLLFGTKRLRSLGSDLGGAVRGFRKSMQDESANAEVGAEDQSSDTEADPPTDPKS